MAAQRLSRRKILALWREDRSDFPAEIRPPWSLAETGEESERRFVLTCSACGKCREACPEGILSPDAKGRPVVAFQRGECTFCGACAEACPTGAISFDLMRSQKRGWQRHAVIDGKCLMAQGVTCRSCGDSCPERAIRFTPLGRGRALPEIEATACTACGACIAVCPPQAVSLSEADPPGAGAKTSTAPLPAKGTRHAAQEL